MIRRFLIACLAAMPLSAAPAWAQGADTGPISLAVQRPRLFGSTRGTLRIDASGVAFEAAVPKDSRRWRYDEIDQFQIRSARRFVMVTYQDRSWKRGGGRQAVEFVVREREISPALVEYLLTRTDRPLVSAVLPPLVGTPLAKIPAKHDRRRGGAEGALVIYADALVFETAQPGESRYWRVPDIFSVLSLGPHRLEVIAYEGGGDELTPFTFSLKSTLSEDAYRSLWERVNRPQPYQAR